MNAPSKAVNKYARLMRLHQPAGIWLLFWPCVWGLALGAKKVLTLDFLNTALLFFIGAVLMRSAGCIVNDIWDRKLDANVERTKLRPLASGEIKLRQAVLLLAGLLVGALAIWIQLYWLTKVLAAIALGFVVAYPAMKRITWWPQAFLGVTFNFGILMGSVETAHLLSIPAMVIYLGAIFWTIGYDTIYAHQDVEDDQMIGIKSTALRFQAAPRRFVALCYALAILLWWIAAIIGQMHWFIYIGLILVGAHLLWQLAYWQPKDVENCLKIFKSNIQLGALFAAGMVISKF